MKQDTIETIIGFVVIIIAVWFFIFAYGTSHKIKPGNTYSVRASFQNAEGINVGSDVMLAGVKIGVVEEFGLDSKTFFATMKLRLDKAISLPKDSQAIITTSGILGSKFISITPGADDDDLVDNDTIKRTQSSINLESLIGKLMYSIGSK